MPASLPTPMRAVGTFSEMGAASADTPGFGRLPAGM